MLKELNMININKGNYHLVNEFLKNKNENIIIGVFMEGCHYCEIMKPEWNKAFKDVKNSKKFKGNILNIDSSVLPLIQSQQIQSISSFPTLIVVKNNNIIEKYSKERTKKNFINFFKKYLIKKPLKIKTLKINRKKVGGLKKRRGGSKTRKRTYFKR